MKETSEKHDSLLTTTAGGLPGPHVPPTFLVPDNPVRRVASDPGLNEQARRLDHRHHVPVAAIKARPLLDRTLLEPAKPISQRPLTFATCVKNTVKYSWLNVLVVFIPVSWALHFSNQSPTITFAISALAIVPCACLLSFATEELAMRIGATLGGLLNATFGNVVELIIAILALTKGQIRVVQAAMVGSILSNCLLVLGCAFCLGGLRFHELGYRVRAAQINISMLGLSAMAIVIPAAFHTAISRIASQSTFPNTIESDILALSHGVAIILLFTYVCFLVFQLWTHSYMYSSPAITLPLAAPQTSDTESGPVVVSPGVVVDNPSGGNNVFRLPSWPTRTNTSSASSVVSVDDDEETPSLNVLFALALIIVVTVLTGVTSEALVESINGVVADNDISEEFVALIILPVIGNAAEHVTAVTVSVKNKLDLAVQISVGSSLQIALFILPFLVILGWIIGQPLTFHLDIFETFLLFVGVLIVNWAIQDGTTHWMEGLSLIMTYVIIALVVWFYDPEALGATGNAVIAAVVS